MNDPQNKNEEIEKLFDRSNIDLEEKFNAAWENRTKKDKYLVVIIGGSRFAISIDFIREVIKIGPITPIPGMNPSITGIMNNSGEIISVINLYKILKLKIEERKKSIYVLILKNTRYITSIQIEGIKGLLEIKKENIEVVDQSPVNKYLQGKVKVEKDSFIPILDIDKIQEDELFSQFYNG
jgi:purine-binding chemotaxis protein CheW